MGAATETRPLATPADAEAQERSDWLKGDTGIAWLDALAEKHLAAVDEWCSAVAQIVDVQAATDESDRAWRKRLRDACARGQEPPKRETDDAVVEAQLEVAREDAVAARDDLARVVVAILALGAERLREWRKANPSERVSTAAARITRTGSYILFATGDYSRFSCCSDGHGSFILLL